MRLFHSISRHSFTILCFLALIFFQGQILVRDSHAKTGEGMTIWFDTGGAVGDGYGLIVQNGAKAAAADMGCDLRLVYSDWNPETMLINFRQAVAANPDGIVIMGHPGDAAFSKLVDTATKKGIVVTSVDTALPLTQAAQRTKGFGYVGTDNYYQGVALAKEILKRTNLQKGDRAFVWGLRRIPERGKRSAAIVEVLENAGIVVDYLEITPEIDKDPVLGAPVVAAQMGRNPDTKVIVVDHGSLTAQMGNHLKNASIKPGKVYVAGFSLSPATATAIEDGFVQLISEAQPFMMGYFGVVQTVLSKKYGFTGFSIDTGGGIIDAENIGQVSKFAKQGIR